MHTQQTNSLAYPINGVDHARRDLIVTLMHGFEHPIKDECIVAPATDESVRSIPTTVTSPTLARRSTPFAQ